MGTQELIVVAQPPEQATRRGPSVLKRMINVFLSPAAAFGGAFPVRSWWIPTLITILFSYSFSGLAVHRVGFPEIVETAIASDAQLEGRISDASSDIKARMYSQIRTTFEVSMIATPLLVLGFNLIIAGVLLGSFNAVLGAKTSFGKIFTVLMYASLIQDVRAISAIITLLVSGNLTGFNIQNPIATNAGFFLDKSVTGGLKVLLTTVDGITLWYLVVLGVGCATVAKVKRSSSYALIFCWWGLIVFVRVAFGALGA